MKINLTDPARLVLWVGTGLLLAGTVFGQAAPTTPLPNTQRMAVTNYTYNETHKSLTIAHKASAFAVTDDNERPGMVTGPAGNQIQAAHTYVDTLYVRKGYRIRLVLPDRLPVAGSMATNAKTYQRWYNYKTDGSFATEGTASGKPADLLTPSDREKVDIVALGLNPIQQPQAYRYANGYVGSPNTGTGQPIGTAIEMMDFYYPTDTEFSSWQIKNAATTSNGTITTASGDNGEYEVAVDVSQYKDFNNTNNTSLNGTSNSLTGAVTTEPSLNHRIVFHIFGIDGDASTASTSACAYEKAMRSGDYQGSGSKYWEEYEINYPFYRTTIHTFDLFALTKDANAFALPVSSNYDESVTVSLETGGDNDASIKLVDPTKGVTAQDYNSGNMPADLFKDQITLTGSNRVVYFQYMDTVGVSHNKLSGVRRACKDDSKSECRQTILVTKKVGETTYHLARYKLVFRKGFEQVHEDAIRFIEGRGEAPNPTSSGWTYWRNFQFRTNKYLQARFGEPVRLDFEGYEVTTNGYSQKPLPWADCSFGFFAGTNPAPGVIAIDQGGAPQWGSYAIRNNGVMLEGSTAHLQIDASDRPGTIARLKIERDLCKGSEIFVTAYVKSQNTGDKKDTSADGSILFTIMGVKEEKDQVTFEPVYRYQSGQISNVYNYGRMPNIGVRQEYDKPNNAQRWTQLYFSFTNTSEEYSRYVLQIDNNSASTQGGDFYLDDVRIYLANPRVEAESLKPGCIDGKRPQVQVRFPWEPLQIANPSGTSMTVCVVDSAAYAQKKAGKVANVESGITAADQIALGASGDSKTFTFTYKSTFSENAEYQEDGSVASSPSSLALGRIDSDIPDLQYLAINLPGDFKLNRTYWILAANGNTTSFADPEDETQRCSIKGTFRIESQNRVELNASLPEDGSFCEGQTYNFKVNMRRWDAVKKEYVEIHGEDFYFDWFFGDEETFTTVHNGKSGEGTGSYTMSLKEALEKFRSANPTADNNAVIRGNVVTDGTCTQEVVNQIKAHIENTVEESGHRSLTLYQLSLNVQLPERLDMVVIPIKDPDLDGKYNGLCWGYLPFSLETDDASPSLRLGFGDVKYPSHYNQYVRIGLKQIHEASQKDKVLQIPLRSAKGASGDGSSGSGNVTLVHFEDKGTTPDPSDENLHLLYLLSTNDPDLQAKTDNAGEFDFPFGWVTWLNASATAAGSYSADDCMRVSFDLNGSLKNLQGTQDENDRITFAPKEGYEYRFAFFFREQPQSGAAAVDGASPKTKCPGRAILDLKVIPEYMKWKGTGDPSTPEGDWTNANNWVRSTKEELKNTNLLDADGVTPYPENKTGKPNYFAPMDFTKITIPRDRQIRLKAPEYNETASSSSSEHKILQLDKNSAINGYEYVEFDLAVKKAESSSQAGQSGTGNVAYDCRTYYINTVDQVHFEPGAEMAGAELLVYDTAWVDYELGKGLWYTLASPYQGGNMFAGDWYTDQTTAREEAPYFSGLAFDSKANSRLNPTVYQRAWDKATATLVTGSTGGNGGTGSKNVAIAGNWSSLYNDVTVPYDQGFQTTSSASAASSAGANASATGFSLKVLDFDNTEGRQSLFRFPKSDTKFAYYTYTNGTPSASGQTATVGRATNEGGKKVKGQLAVSSLASSLSLPLVSATTKSDPETGTKYYLVGNPFMAHLDMQAFFEANTHLSPKYWLVDQGNQQVAVGSTEEGWITVNLTQMVQGVEEPLSASTSLVAPLQSFFVTLNEATRQEAGAGEGLSVTFTAAMQQLKGIAKAPETGAGSGSPAPLLRITALNGETGSCAVVAYASGASDGFADDEDAELFLDSNLGDRPMVYTVAGDRAATINRTAHPGYLPLGVFSRSGETVQLAFEGLDGFGDVSLYDAVLGVETPLMEGSCVSVAGDSHGRYFLRAGTPTANEALPAPDETIRVYSVQRGRVVIASEGAPLLSVCAYGIDGRLLRRVEHPGGTVCTLDLPAGPCVIHATAENERTRAKISRRLKFVVF